MVSPLDMKSTTRLATHATLGRGAWSGTQEAAPDAQVDEVDCAQTDNISNSWTPSDQREELQDQTFTSSADRRSTLSCVCSQGSTNLDDFSSECQSKVSSSCRSVVKNSEGRCECEHCYFSTMYSDRKCDTSKCVYLCCLVYDHNVSSSLGDETNSLPKLRRRVDSRELIESNNEKVHLKCKEMNTPNLSFSRQKPVMPRSPNSKRRRPLNRLKNLQPLGADQIVFASRTCTGRTTTRSEPALRGQVRGHVSFPWLHKALSACVVLMTVLLPGAVVLAGPVNVPGSSLAPSPVRESLWLGHTRRLDIRRTPCKSTSGQDGVCMFNFECLQRSGDLIGTCMDGFLFGVCCKLSDLNLPDASDTMASSTAVESSVVVPSLDNKLQLGSTNKKPTPSSTLTRVSYVTKPSGHTMLFTKTKPNNSVLLYAAESLTKRPFVIANSQNSKESGVSKIYTITPKLSERNSTVTAVLKVRDDVSSHANKSQLDSSQIASNVSDQHVISNQGSTEVKQDVYSIAGNDHDNEIFQTTSRSSDSTISGSHSGSTPESSLVWTLLPQSTLLNREPSKSSSTKVRFASMSPSSVSVSAFMTFPKFSVHSTTPLSPASSSVKSSSENYLGASYEENVVDVTQASSYLVKAKPLETLTSTTTATPTTTSWLDSYRLNASDPMAFWTTTRPSRRPVLQPRPVPSSTEDETTEEPFFWTTSKPSLRPRPSSKPIPAPEKEPAIKTKLSSMLLPVKPHVDASLKAEGLIEELIASMSDTLIKDETKITNNTPPTTTPSSSEPWASSTYAILPVEIDIAENTIDVDSNAIKTSSSPPDQESSTSPSTLQTQPTTVSTVVSSPMTGTLEKPGIPTATESDISGTTPIDEFIENLLNSLMMSNSSTAPPIDLDLIQQMLNGSDIGSMENLGPAIASIASFANVSLNLIEDSADEQFSPSSSTTTQATTSSTAFSPPLRTLVSTTTSTTTTTTVPTTTRTTTTTTPTTTTPTTSTYKNWNWRTTCGVRPLSRTGRIVNGEETAFGVWPWQVLVKESTWLGLFTKVKCGGVLLSDRYVLTAAHCQPGFLGSLIVVLGDHDLSGDFEPAPATERNVKRVVVHRGYIARTFDNDLALLELDRPIKFAEHILPICLPENDDDYVGQVGTVTGWGRLAYGGNIPKKLNEVRLPIVPNSECQSWFREAGHGKKIKPEFMCAGFKSGEKDSCEGDSGGPLTVRGPDGRWVLAGTVSHGIKCAYPNLPGVYMRMSFYKPWILKVMEG